MAPMAAPPPLANMSNPHTPEPVSFPWCKKGEVACLNNHLTGNLLVTA